jgi:L-seryl-tRNA(Ser) seleniumtransferase
VINATGVLLHTNLGRAPLALAHPAQAINVELDLTTGARGSRQQAVGGLLAALCGAEAAIVVNNNAAAVLLVLAALARDRQVLVSRGESVEIGGGFRVPEVMEQSGAELVDVGTTNRTRLTDYTKALARKHADVALVLKVHPSNYRVQGFVEETPTEQLATLPVPVVADIGSGLLDATCPWLPGAPPAGLAGRCPPDARGRGSAGDVQRRQAARRPAGGHHRRRAGLVKACAASARPPCARRARAAARSSRWRWPTSTAPRRHHPFWRMASASVVTCRCAPRSS